MPANMEMCRHQDLLDLPSDNETCTYSSLVVLPSDIGPYPLTTSLPVCTNLVTKGSIIYDQLALCMAGQSALRLVAQLVKDNRKGVEQLQLSSVGKDHCITFQFLSFDILVLLYIMA